MTKMTTKEKLAEAQRLVAMYQEQLKVEQLQNNVETGDTITFSHGRGDNRRDLTGTVLGEKADSNGRWLKVQAGEGFDAETLTIRPAAITANPDAEKRLAAEA